MIVDAIKNGIVIDHITAGHAMELYSILELDKLDCTVAVLKNVPSKKKGKKDIIKIDTLLDVDFDVLGYVDPNITVSIIKDSKVEKKLEMKLPATVTNVIKCKNPRCITSTEQELDHIFKLTNAEKKIYRCIYCESKAK
ncbi:MAG: aspartate carbamoyltransferase regulatory subunit [Ruminococcaceae bacterium]|nr:aspartate carbamoyltransferase regulatory subunit [Oscillospiraceae bacterium]